MHKRIAAFVCLAAVVALLAGCPPPPPSPFDTTGAYAGTWQGRSNEAEVAEQQEVVACPLTMTLTQDVSLAWPQDHGVTGTVEIDYSCIELPEWVDELPDSTVQVSGVLGDEGVLTLLSGGCTTALCLALTLSGQAEDLDGDGFMDVYAGDWSFIVLLAGVQPFGVAGTFEVQVVGA